MFEHAGPLIGIPGAIKAILDLLDRIKAGNVAPKSGADDAEKQLLTMRQALDSFAQDALELTAFKELHAITNQFMIDLRETFTMITPDDRRSRAHYSENLIAIKAELMSMRQGARAASQLANLRDSPKLMQHLKDMPSAIQEIVPVPPWDDYFWQLLKAAEGECENYKNFYAIVQNLRGLNFALNNVADHNIKRGITQFDSIMDRLRAELAKTDHA